MYKGDGMKKINLILVTISIIVGLSFFIVSYTNYRQTQNFYNNAKKVQGYVYAVRKIKDNTYSFEYKYVVNKTEYKSYVSKYTIDTLKDNDYIDVYYDSQKPSDNMISKPSIKNIIPSIIFMLVLSVIGIINYIKGLKKSRV